MLDHQMAPNAALLASSFLHPQANSHAHALYSRPGAQIKVHSLVEHEGRRSADEVYVCVEGGGVPLLLADMAHHHSVSRRPAYVTTLPAFPPFSNCRVHSANCVGAGTYVTVVVS
jgi:hypothetical protein